MGRYRITSRSGEVYGVYEGSTPEEAWEAMVQDAGGHTTDESGRDTAGTPEDWIIEAK
jgi:hypothetical protein